MPAAALWLFRGSCSGWGERQDPDSFPLTGTEAPGHPDPDPHLPPWAPHRAADPCPHLCPCGASLLPRGGSPGSAKPGTACAEKQVQRCPASGSGTARTSNLTAGFIWRCLGGRRGKEVTWGSAGPAHTRRGAGTVFWHCPCPPLDAPLPQSHQGCSGHCGHHLPPGSVPGRAPGRVSPSPGRARGYGWISLLGACSTPGLGCEGRTDSLRAGGSRGLPGPRARPAALTAAARQGWRSPSQPSLPSLWERADPLRLPPAALAVSVAALDREALGVSWQWGARTGSRRGPGEHGTGPTACPPWHGVQLRPPQDGPGGAGAGCGGGTCQAADPSRGGFCSQNCCVISSGIPARVVVKPHGQASLREQPRRAGAHSALETLAAPGDGGHPPALCPVTPQPPSRILVPRHIAARREEGTVGFPWDRGQ